MIRAKIPAFDRLTHALEKRALRRLDARARSQAHARREGGHPWRSPAKLWPDFGDD